MKNNIRLLKVLLLSTSGMNTYRYSKDKKKRGKVIGNAVGMLFLYLLLMGYSILICIGYGETGLIGAAPGMCAVTISVMAFFFTVFKTNGYLFNFKEYDMLMSLPFEAKTVAACKFLYMYIKSLPWYLSISAAMLLGYGIYERPSAYVYPIWVVLTLFLPVIPMLIAALTGFLIAKLSTGFKKTNIVQTVLTFIFIIFCFSARFIIENMFKDDKVQSTLENVSGISGAALKLYPPAGWFAKAITGKDITGMLLLIFVTALLFAALFYFAGRSYRRINSALRSHTAERNFKMTGQKKHSVVMAVAYKEFKRFTGSTAYMTNAAIGEIMVALLSIVALIIGFDRIIAVVTKGAPLDSFMLQPAIPFIVYFFIGMVATTACSPSLEGKNYWILQSLPIEKKTVYQGKMLFNMLLGTPFMLFSTVCLCISAKAPFADAVLYIILGILLCAFSTAWGCVCGVKHIKLDWENEIEVIKQSSAVTVYMLPNMFAVMIITVLAVFLGTFVNHKLLTLLFILITALLALLSYRRVMVLAGHIDKKV